MELTRHDDGFDEGPSGDPSWGSPYIDGAWGRTANPNSAEGELQNIAAFGAGLVRLTGGRRTLARLAVWLILIGFAVMLVLGIISNH